MTLREFCGDNFTKYPTHKRWHHNFLEVYDQLWSFRRYEPLIILELGVNVGGSARLFHDYFPNATYVGVEHEQCHIDYINNTFNPTVNYPRMKLFRLSAYKEEEWRGFPYEKFDVIIDDAVALPQDFDNPIDVYSVQTFTLNFFHQKLNPNGCICIEDIQHRRYEDRIRKNFVGDQSRLTFYDLRPIHDYYDNMMMVYK